MRPSLEVGMPSATAKSWPSGMTMTKSRTLTNCTAATRRTMARSRAVNTGAGKYGVPCSLSSVRLQSEATSFDEVARRAPLAVLVERHRDGLHGRGLVRERGVVFDDHVFAVGRSRQRGPVGRRLLLSRAGRAQRSADGAGHLLPLVLFDRGLERSRGFLPALGIFAAVGEREPGSCRACGGFLLLRSGERASSKKSDCQPDHHGIAHERSPSKLQTPG